MKPFALPLILTALALHGTAFFGIWTAPGLESLPTLESLRESSGKQPSRESSIIPLSSGESWSIGGVRVH